MFVLFLKMASIATIGAWIVLGLPLYFFGNPPIVGGHSLVVFCQHYAFLVDSMQCVGLYIGPSVLS